MSITILNSQVAYPSVRQAWLLFGVCILGQLIASPIQFLTGEENSIGIFLMYSIAMIIGLVFGLWQKTSFQSSKLVSEPLFESRSVKISTYLLVIFSIPCLGMISGPITQLIPMPELFLDQMDKILGSFGLFTFLTIVVAAPIFEELIFRGIILDGFLKQMEPKKAILFASFMFALIHMNPWQFTHTFLLGGFIGWIYYRTRSIWPCIFIHFVNNGLVFTAGLMAGNLEKTSPPEPSILSMLAVVPLGVLFLIGLIKLLEQDLGKHPINWLETEEEKEEEE